VGCVSYLCRVTGLYKHVHERHPMLSGLAWSVLLALAATDTCADIDATGGTGATLDGIARLMGQAGTGGQHSSAVGMGAVVAGERGPVAAARRLISLVDIVHQHVHLRHATCLTEPNPVFLQLGLVLAAAWARQRFGGKRCVEAAAHAAQDAADRAAESAANKNGGGGGGGDDSDDPRAQAAARAADRHALSLSAALLSCLVKAPLVEPRSSGARGHASLCASSNYPFAAVAGNAGSSGDSPKPAGQLYPVPCPEWALGLTRPESAVAGALPKEDGSRSVNVNMLAPSADAAVAPWLLPSGAGEFARMLSVYDYSALGLTAHATMVVLSAIVEESGGTGSSVFLGGPGIDSYNDDSDEDESEGVDSNNIESNIENNTQIANGDSRPVGSRCRSTMRLSMVAPPDVSRVLYVEALLPALYSQRLLTPTLWAARRRVLEKVMAAPVGSSLQEGRVMLGVYWSVCGSDDSVSLPPGVSPDIIGYAALCAEKLVGAGLVTADMVREWQVLFLLASPRSEDAWDLLSTNAFRECRATMVEDILPAYLGDIPIPPLSLDKHRRRGLVSLRASVHRIAIMVDRVAEARNRAAVIVIDDDDDDDEVDNDDDGVNDDGDKVADDNDNETGGKVAGDAAGDDGSAAMTGTKTPSSSTKSKAAGKAAARSRRQRRKKMPGTCAAGGPPDDTPELPEVIAAEVIHAGWLILNDLLLTVADSAAVPARSGGALIGENTSLRHKKYRFVLELNWFLLLFFLPLSVCMLKKKRTQKKKKLHS
jgi:hypothetical protein